MKVIRGEIHDETNILYNYTIPITIPILECILNRGGMTKYKGSIYYIFFKLSGLTPHITMKEYNTILNTFNVLNMFVFVDSVVSILFLSLSKKTTAKTTTSSN